ncbi:hypothetical protein [Streptomyces sp. WAC 06725]|uniref:hypothetical protein n=1 Tax=Streptomyces sp. WAC 06725 TaxID=2203209 RepID=UPI0011CF7424|nr:hypothetical protein [Streptomyces sp. WAC 06725]
MRTLFAYMTQHPEESPVLAPLHRALGDPVRDGYCGHDDLCPQAAAGALVLDERESMLGLWEASYPRWCPPRLLPHAADTSLYDTAERATISATGITELWRTDCIADTVDIHFKRQRIGNDVRLSYEFRYVFRSYSYALPLSTPRHIQWHQISEVVQQQRLQRRLVDEYLAEGLWCRISGLAV